MRDAYSLEFPALNINIKSWKTSPEIIILCSIVYAFAVSMSDSFYALILASFLPLILFFKHKINLIHVNIMNLIMIFTLALTWPDLSDGLIMGMKIAFRVNMIYIVFTNLLLPLGFSGIYQGLYSLGLPEKLRVLIILTLRGIFILRERMEAALMAVKLRGNNIHGLMKFRVFAYILGGVLLKGIDKSERMMMAVICRGGFGGFNQFENNKLNKKDITIFSLIMIYALMVMIVNYIV